MKQAFFAIAIIPPTSLRRHYFAWTRPFDYNPLMPATLNEVRSYYDQNTPLFLRFGASLKHRPSIERCGSRHKPPEDGLDLQ
jgi:hypothetical protein